MINKTLACVALSCAFVARVSNVAAQGTFQNLDFESATPVSSGGNTIFVKSGLPGWDVHSTQSDERISSMFYNAYPGDGISLLGPDAPSGRIEGNFTVLLAGARISQIGDVPSSAQSLLFKANGDVANFSVVLGGNFIPFLPLETHSDYVLYGGDISSLAGQTAALTISGSSLYLDSISFSVQPVPEPSSLWLLCSAFALVGLWKCKRVTR